MEYTDFMNSFVVRVDIFDDICYLQKCLRVIVKFHQKLSTKLYVTSSAGKSNGKNPSPSKNFFAIRKFMDELEEEMEDISKEQKLLTDILKTSINQYTEMLWKDCKIKVPSDVANGYITRALQFHYQKNVFTIVPTNVKVRTAEEEYQKRFNDIKRASEDEPGSFRQESLLKPKFRKSSTSSSTPGPSGRVEKKPGRKNTVIEARHAKLIYQNQNGEGIAHGRMNLLRALNKVKTEQVDGKSFADDFDDSSSTMMMSKYNRSDEDCSDQSSYDGMPPVDPLKIGRKRRSPASNASSEDPNAWLKLLPPLPKEPPPKTDYNQEEFLSLFCLTTPKIAETLKLQQSKRKRRNCFKNENKDYHYGNFDLNEAAFRLRMTNNKRSILYSPNIKRK